LIIQFATAASLPALTPDDRVAGEALAALGVQVEAVVWSEHDPGSAGRVDAVVIRSCWDYHLREREFSAWLDRLERQGLVVINELPLVRWNMHKKYLDELQRRGVPVVPTLWVNRGDERSLGDLLDVTGWREVVVKPAISACAYETWQVRSHDVAAGEERFMRLRATGDVLVQKFLTEITTAGEWSLVFFGSEYSHAARKLPRPGDFRVQVEHGGCDMSDVPPATLIDDAARAVRCLPGSPVYTRVDGVVVDGVFMLMEVECIDPFLYFQMHEPAAARFAAEVMRRVGDGVGQRRQ
jgi:glutathione synthase/RimK-type ligase-like ATP-grasp enzyme